MQAERDAKIAAKMQKEFEEQQRRDNQLAIQLQRDEEYEPGGAYHETNLTQSVEHTIDDDDASFCLGGENLAELKKFMDSYPGGSWILRRILKPELVSRFASCREDFREKGFFFFSFFLFYLFLFFQGISNHVILAFHGTKAANVNSIADKGLLMPGQVKVAHGSAYGRGIYVSPDPSFALGYAPEGRLFVCAVLPG